MSKKFLAGVFAVAAFAFAITVSAAYDFGATTLRVGSKGEAVKAVQTVVGATPVDGIFGAMTKAKVMAWQAANGLVADGVFGPASKAKANAVVGTTPTTPTTPSTPSVLKGGAGDLTVDDGVSKNEESSLKEGEEDVKVVALKLTAEDSDIEVTNVKLMLTNFNHVAGDSEKIADYLSEVKVFLGSKEVASVDADEFTRDSKTWDEFTKSVSLSGAVIEEDESDYLYVAVSAIDDIDSDDISARLSATVESLRYTDATGAIMNAASTDLTSATEDFGFTGGDSEDEFDIKSSSADPDAATLKVEESDTSDEFLVGAFKMDVDEDSSDLSVLELPVTVTVTNNDVALDSIDEIIDTLIVKIDGEEYEADIDSDLTALATGGTATYLVEFDSDEMVIEAGDVVEVKLYATFAEQGGDSANYKDGTDLVFAVDADNLDIENEEGDTVTIAKKDGLFTSESFNLSIADVTVDAFRWSVNSTNTILDFYFDVEAGDEDFNVLLASITDNDEIVKSSAATVGTPVLTRSSGDSVDTITGGFTVGEDEKTTFRLRYDIGAVNGDWAEITIESVAGVTVPDDKQVSPTATVNGL